jgi:uncharacterized membrane protein YdjX (TVP38/TMEM64 family)
MEPGSGVRSRKGCGAGPAEKPLVSLGASLAAMLAGLIIDEVFQPFLGTGPTLVLSFAGSTVAFFFARRWLKELRGS